MSRRKRTNKETLDNFIAYCKKNPDERFWQALKNWSGQPIIAVMDEIPFDTSARDTFLWLGKREV